MTPRMTQIGQGCLILSLRQWHRREAILFVSVECPAASTISSPIKCFNISKSCRYPATCSELWDKSPEWFRPTELKPFSTHTHTHTQFHRQLRAGEKVNLSIFVRRLGFRIFSFLSGPWQGEECQSPLSDVDSTSLRKSLNINFVQLTGTEEALFAVQWKDD